MYVPSAREDWQCCFYEFQASITYNGKTVQLKEGQIISVLLEKDYDSLHMPILLMDLSLDYPIHDEIKKDPKSTMQLRVDKCIGIQEDGKINVTSKTIFINSVFSFVTLNHTPKSTYYEKSVNDVNQKQEGDYLSASTGEVERHILVKKEDLTKSKKIINASLPNVTLTEAICPFMWESGCRDVLMANLDNVKVYDELFIPAMPLLECLIYLKDRYGMHKEDTTIFMDYDTMYVVRKSALCTVYKNRETKNVCICLNSPESVQSTCAGVMYTGNMTYVNVGYEQFGRMVGGTVSDQTVGTDYILFNENDLSTNTVKIQNDRALDGGNTTVKTVKGFNEFIDNQIKMRKAEEQNTFEMICTGIDLSILTPNKHYMIASNSTEIVLDAGGSYRLSRHVTEFTRTGGLMLPITTLVLKKTTE